MDRKIPKWLVYLNDRERKKKRVEMNENDANCAINCLLVEWHRTCARHGVLHFNWEIANGSLAI